jgi:hypothetical protein
MGMLLASIAIFLQLQELQPLIVPAGTSVDARLEMPVRTATSAAGDAVSAVLSEPVRAAGRIVLPEGSRLNGRVETIAPATVVNRGRLRLAFREIHFPDGRTMPTWITSSFSASPPKRSLRYVLFVTIGGAAGAFAGGKSARVAGIIGGTLAGFLIAANSSPEKLPDVELKRGELLRLQLGEDLRLD